MKHLFQNLVFFILLIIFFSCANSIQESGTASINGTVLDKTTGEPVPTVKVTLQEVGESTITGTDGTFLFNNLREGSFTLLLTKEGYNETSISVSVTAGKSTMSHMLIERIPAVMTLDRQELDFGDNYSNNTMSFSMVNRNYLPLDWEIVYSCSWIKQVDPIKSSVKLAFGKTQTIVVIIEREFLQPGQNETVIVVRTSDGSSELTVKAIGEEKRSPSLNVLPASEIKATSALLNAEMTDKGIPLCLERGFVFSDSPMPTKETAIKVIAATVNDNDMFSVRAGDLTLGKTYYVRAYASNKTGLVYSTNQAQFTTIAVFPEVETLAAYSENPENKTAVLRGKITYSGDPVYTEKGFVWSATYENPTKDDNYVVVSGSGDGDFEKRVTFPSSNSKIYVRAYAVNSRGIAYGTASAIFIPPYTILTSPNLWVQNSDVSKSLVDYYNARDLCNSSTLGGYDNWRLPTRSELIRLYNNNEEIGGFVLSGEYSRHGTCDYYYWSGDANTVGGGGLFYYVDFSDGSTYYASAGWLFRARCVRTLN